MELELSPTNSRSPIVPERHAGSVQPVPALPNSGCAPAGFGQEQTLPGLCAKKEGLRTADIHSVKPNRAAPSRRWFRRRGGLGEWIAWMNDALKHVAFRQRLRSVLPGSQVLIAVWSGAAAAPVRADHELRSHRSIERKSARSGFSSNSPWMGVSPREGTNKTHHRGRGRDRIRRR